MEMGILNNLIPFMSEFMYITIHKYSTVIHKKQITRPWRTGNIEGGKSLYLKNI